MATTIPIYQVDAFADRPFAGNPAAVCPLGAWLPDELMQAIANENNLSETAFLVGGGGRYHLRWFTPVVEVDLCGHATLAAAFVILTRHEPGEQVVFTTQTAGELRVTREPDGRFTLDLPAYPPRPVAAPAGLSEALGVTPVEVLQGSPKLLVVLDAAEAVAALEPDFRAVAALPSDGVIVTAPGRDGVDFVSRYFAPAAGIDEDPVTGSAHCDLTPYWAGRLGRTTLEARQISRRGGALTCRLEGERVRITGAATLVLEGTLHV